MGTLTDQGSKCGELFNINVDYSCTKINIGLRHKEAHEPMKKRKIEYLEI
jgi:hypothetical protein